jgi:hypothetical protein
MEEMVSEAPVGTAQRTLSLLAKADPVVLAAADRRSAEAQDSVDLEALLTPSVHSQVSEAPVAAAATVELGTMYLTYSLPLAVAEAAATEVAPAATCAVVEGKLAAEVEAVLGPWAPSSRRRAMEAPEAWLLPLMLLVQMGAMDRSASHLPSAQ